MTKTHLLLAALVLPSVAFTAPANADTFDCDHEVIVDYNDGVRGSITVDCTYDPEGASFYKVVPDCTFAGVLTPNNTLIVEFAGSAQSSTNDTIKAPQLTYIKCTIRQGALAHSADFLANVPASATAGSTLTATNGPKEWPVAPITICAQAFGLFGNDNPVIVRLPEACKTPTP